MCEYCEQNYSIDIICIFPSVTANTYFSSGSSFTVMSPFPNSLASGIVGTSFEDSFVDSFLLLDDDFSSLDFSVSREVRLECGEREDRLCESITGVRERDGRRRGDFEGDLPR